jgi:hypothetical protein
MDQKLCLEFRLSASSSFLTTYLEGPALPKSFPRCEHVLREYNAKPGRTTGVSADGQFTALSDVNIIFQFFGGFFSLRFWECLVVRLIPEGSGKDVPG